jgi:hypothetical protein
VGEKLLPVQRQNSWTKSRLFLLVILALRFLFLQTHATVFVKEKGGKPDRKPYPLSYDIKSENSQDYAPETSMEIVRS